MKKHLLLGSALLSGLLMFSQNGKTKPVATRIIGDAAEIAALKFRVEPSHPVSSSNTQINSGPARSTSQGTGFMGKSSSLPPSTVTWSLLCGSSNVYGMLVSQSRPLQYNDNLNAISFIHRKSDSYTENPAIPANAKSGVIVAEISSNWGTTWDSTAIYVNATDWARYPQGAIYNPTGNNSIANAYVVGSGPCTSSASTWVSNWYASKKLNAFTNTADPTVNAQQNLPMVGTSFPTNQGKHGWPRYGFTAVDNGSVFTLAALSEDHQTLGTAAKMRGVAVVKGTFNAGVFTWTTDSLLPSLIKDKDSVRQIGAAPQMAWNERGTVGYVLIMGAASGATINNRGIHPIIYKTTNSGDSWVQMTGLDFNTTFKPVTNHIASVSNSDTTSIPFFWDYDIVVDSLDKVHIGAIVGTAASKHADSLFYYSQYTISINPGHNYKWAHVAGQRPYVYDFFGDGTSWNYMTIDSLWSEDPGAATTATGYSLNPWDNTGTNNAKIGIDSRLQLGRTPDGKYLTFSWADTDTNFTPQFVKYNVQPNITSRCLAVTSGTNPYVLSPTEIVVSKTGNINSKVAGNCMLHYMSPTTGKAECMGTAALSHTIDIFTPFTVTSNQNTPLTQLQNNSTYFGKAKLSYAFSGQVLPTSVAVCSIVSVQEYAQDGLMGSILYPNPAKDQTKLLLNLSGSESVNVEVYSVVGQLVKSAKLEGTEGENNVNIELSGLTPGVYMVKTTVGKKTGTRKLIIQ